MLRLLILVLILSVPIVCCGSRKASEPAAKKEPRANQPVDLGDPNEPLEIRGLKGARQVKKEIEAQQEQQKKELNQ